MATVKETRRHYLLNSPLKAICIATIGFTSIAHADLTDLVDAFEDDLQVSAALANHATYLALVDASSGGTGFCNDDQRVGQPGCDGSTFTVFENVRKLVHTANQLAMTGSTQFSLELSLEELGDALRWTAGEEFAAQGSLTSEFINGQLSGLTGRLTDLRFGTSGFTAGGTSALKSAVAAYRRSGLLGGGASADSSEDYSHWGGFVNGTYGDGDKRATVLENGFDFDGYQISAGIDYRFDNSWIVGALIGYTGQELEFDSSQSIVDGEIEADGFSFMPFGLYQSEHLFGSIAAGYQHMNLDMDRAIRIQSLNPIVPGTTTRSLSNTDADILTLFATLGYSFRSDAFSAEPYLELKHRDVSIDGFTERDISGAGFNFTVGDQDIDSTEAALGLIMQYTLTPQTGVFIPFIDVQWRNQFEDDSRNISASYAGSSLAANFNLPTDKLDDQYYVITVGLSSILRGGRQKRADGVVSGGIQVYANYKFIENLDNYSEGVLAGGIRYEF